VPPAAVPQTEVLGEEEEVAERRAAEGREPQGAAQPGGAQAPQAPGGEREGLPFTGLGALSPLLGGLGLLGLGIALRRRLPAGPAG
jgi:hypothetical protein